MAGTRVLRGEEVAGRWELLACGRTTRREATVDALAGLGAALLVATAVLTAAVGARSDVGIGVGPACLS